jgi:hypothetical protein
VVNVPKIFSIALTGLIPGPIPWRGCCVDVAEIEERLRGRDRTRQLTRSREYVDQLLTAPKLGGIPFPF